MDEPFRRIVRIPSHRQLNRADLRGKRILVRVDFNVPIVDGKSADLRRVDAMMPTIKKIIEKDAKEINIIGHLGRPDGKKDRNLSTIQIAKVICSKIPYKCKLTEGKSDSQSPALSQFYKIGDKIRVFENLRFDPREEKNSEDFAKELSGLGDVFVQDAFANIHRNHASMLAIQDLLPTYAGLLVEKETNILFKILSHPDRPFVAIIGGAKIEDKLPAIEALTKTADAVLIGGKTANEWMVQDHPKNENVYLPVDGLNKLGSIVPINEATLKNGIFDIGPQTVMLFKSILSSAKTIFWNGNLGMTESKRYIYGTHEVARFIAKLQAEKVISGGNTAEVIDEMKLSDKFDFISTGGGATSDFIAGKKLPVLEKLLT